MRETIGTKQLRLELGSVMQRVNKGTRFTVMYRSRPAFDIVPVGVDTELGSWKEDSLYRAAPVGRSRKGDAARDHDRILYT